MIFLGIDRFNCTASRLMASVWKLFYVWLFLWNLCINAKNYYNRLILLKKAPSFLKSLHIFWSRKVHHILPPRLPFKDQPVFYDFVYLMYIYPPNLDSAFWNFILVCLVAFFIICSCVKACKYSYPLTCTLYIDQY